MRRLITEAAEKAAGIIGEHRPQIEHLIDELERHETLDRAQIEACLGPARERAEATQKSGLATA